MNNKLLNSRKPLDIPKLVFVFVAAFVIGCVAGKAKAQTGLETRALSITTAAGATVQVEAEIAKTAEQREAGLMWRKELADGKGMLFVFDRDQVLSFWMKNTLIDLSIAYINFDGTILDIKEMKAKDLSPVTSSRSCRYALEAPAGWFSRAGISVGDHLDTGGI